MQHAIEYHHFSCEGLQAGHRKRTPVGQLLRITRGAALLRLGQHELLLPAGSSFWLCADALAAFSPLSGCHYDRLGISLRLDQPQQAGWLQATPLLNALLDSLAQWQRPQTWQGAYGQRLQVILDELQQCAISPQGHGDLQAVNLTLCNFGHNKPIRQWKGANCNNSGNCCRRSGCSKAAANRCW